ncbi:MAG: O-methyltransferase [Defluviitaleaceae bacterium]|nr:O-methyltransferase [Defluviitaleaceae bacterium]
MGILCEDLAEFLGKFDKDVLGALGDLQRRSYSEGLPIISRDVVNFLSLMLSVKPPHNVLEIGCAVGFSASLFAEHLAKNGRVTTIDRYELMTSRAKKNFEMLGITDKIRLIEEDAATALPRLMENGESFDFIFMDCSKGQYVRFFPYVVQLLEDGGIFCTDDIFQGGSLVKDLQEIPRRDRTIHRNMHEFLQMVMAEDALRTVILPIGDGLLVSHKKKVKNG